MPETKHIRMLENVVCGGENCHRGQEVEASIADARYLVATDHAEYIDVGDDNSGPLSTQSAAGLVQNGPQPDGDPDGEGAVADNPEPEPTGESARERRNRTAREKRAAEKSPKGDGMKIDGHVG